MHIFIAQVIVVSEAKIELTQTFSIDRNMFAITLLSIEKSLATNFGKPKKGPQYS